jgi:hypothetical protein
MPAAATWRSDIMVAVQQRFPAGDGPGAVPRLIVVRDAWEQSAQLEDGQHFATPIEGGADRGGFRLRYNEHPCSMGTRCEGGKPRLNSLWAPFTGAMVRQRFAALKTSTEVPRNPHGSYKNPPRSNSTSLRRPNVTESATASLQRRHSFEAPESESDYCTLQGCPSQICHAWCHALVPATLHESAGGRVECYLGDKPQTQKFERTPAAPQGEVWSSTP